MSIQKSTCLCRCFFYLPYALLHQRYEYQRNYGHQLYQNVYAGAGGILERVSHGVAHNGRLVRFAALAAEAAAFNVFLGVVPCAAGVAHEYCHKHARYHTARKQSAKGGGAEQEADQQGSNDGYCAGENHFL